MGGKGEGKACRQPYMQPRKSSLSVCNTDQEAEANVYDNRVTSGAQRNNI